MSFPYLWDPPPGWSSCRCEYLTPCRCPTKTACPLCEEPYCTDCLERHHVCKAQPQDIEVPGDVREPVEV